MVIAISFQVFGVIYPPLVDLPNHLTRHAIQCDGPLAANLSQYFDFAMRAVPNLTADLIYQFDGACTDVFLTNRILIQIMTLNLVASVYALHFALWRKVSIWPAASCLVAYNGSYAYGFENFVLAAPFALYLFALWVVLSERRTFIRLTILVPLSLGLYFAHIIAFGFFIILVAGWEVRRAAKMKPGWSRFFWRASGTFLLVLPAIVHFIIINHDSQIQSSGSAFMLNLRAHAIFSMTVPRIPKYLTLSELFLPLLMVETMAVLIIFGIRKKVLRITSKMRWALVLGFIAALLAPGELSGVAFVHIRYPFLVAATFIASTMWVISWRKQVALSLLILTLFAARTYEMKQEWQQHDAEVRELITAAEIFPAGAWILPVASEASDVVIRHSHSISYLGLYYPVFTPNLFNGSNPLSPNEDVAKAAREQMFPPPIDWVVGHVEAAPSPRHSIQEDWATSFSHFLVFGNTPVDRNSLPEGVSVIHTGSFFTILQNANAFD